MSINDEYVIMETLPNVSDLSRYRFHGSRPEIFQKSL